MSAWNDSDRPLNRWEVELYTKPVLQDTLAWLGASKTGNKGTLIDRIMNLVDRSQYYTNEAREALDRFEVQRRDVKLARRHAQMSSPVRPESRPAALTEQEQTAESRRFALTEPFLEVMQVLTHPTMVGGSDRTSGETRLSFELGGYEMKYVRHHEWEVQVACLLRDDAVKYRLRWPRGCTLKVNGLMYPLRCQSTATGASGRDDAQCISPACFPGKNMCVVYAADSRAFVAMVVLTREKDFESVCKQVSLPGERDFTAAVQKLVKHLNPGAPKHEGEAQSWDAEDDVLMEGKVVVSLRCALGGGRVKVPARMATCGHLSFFDRDTFLTVCRKTRKWQCPICMSHQSFDSIRVDPYFLCIVNHLRSVRKACVCSGEVLIR